MKEYSAQGLLGTTIEKLKDLVDVSTIIGDPIEAGGVTIVPVSKVTYGFASGGSDFPSKSNAEIFGGGGGAGITIAPVAFIVVRDGEVSIKHVAEGEGGQAERIIGMVPDVVDKLSALVNKFIKKDEPDLNAAAEAFVAE
ncbi:MAG: sporulation protein YtfJ [Oscillospiraceae bacterium]|nr:sporulation protein YtfJ [Oscillospiraceae bacterium]